MIPYCNATGVGLLPWSPLAAGVLAHPWTDRTDPREQTDIFLKMLFRSGESTAAHEIVNRVEAVAKDKGTSMAQIAAAWVLSKGAWPVMGLDSIQRIDEAVEATYISLTEEQIKYIEEPYVPKVALTF